MSLLDFSRERSLELAPTSVKQSLRHVVELDPSEPLLTGDRSQIDQLFLNLVLNTRQAIPNGGRLSLRTACKHDKILVEVCDTGVGVSEEIRERIFNPFFTTRDVGEGTGLGLTVSDSIVASHGGKLTLESNAGKGIVEDEPLLRVSMADAPRGEGWTVDVAEDGIEGLALYELHASLERDALKEKPGNSVPAEALSLHRATERAEIQAIRAALGATSGRRTEAAELLGISRKTLWEKLERHGINVDS